MLTGSFSTFSDVFFAFLICLNRCEFHNSYGDLVKLFSIQGDLFSFFFLILYNLID